MCEEKLNNKKDTAAETKTSEINEASSKNEVALRDENEKLKSEIDLLKAQADEYLDKLQRAVAEFDNFKKRTQKEKDAIRKDVLCETVTEIIPVADNLERALCATEKDCDYKTVREGIELVYRQFREIMDKLDVEEISSMGESFNPEIHNAVMHVEDDNFGSNEIIEVFQKGYTLKDRVIRHSVVKVAN